MFTRRVISKVSEQKTPVWFGSRESLLCRKQRDCVSVRENNNRVHDNEIQENKALEAKTRGRGGWIGKPLSGILMLFVASWKWIPEKYLASRNNCFLDWIKYLFRLWYMQPAWQMSLMRIGNSLKSNLVLSYTRLMDFQGNGLSLFSFSWMEVQNSVKLQLGKMWNKGDQG